MDVVRQVVHTEGVCMHVSEIQAGGFVRGVKSSRQTVHVVGGVEGGGKGSGGSEEGISSRQEDVSVGLEVDEEGE